MIELVGLGRGLGAFVVSTYDIVVNSCPSVTLVDVVGGGFRVVVEFLLDVNVVRLFTATVVTTGFRVVVTGTFTTVAVEFFGGFEDDPIGRLVGLFVDGESDVRFKTGLFVIIGVVVVGLVFDDGFIVVLFVTFLLEFCID